MADNLDPLQRLEVAHYQVRQIILDFQNRIGALEAENARLRSADGKGATEKLLCTDRQACEVLGMSKSTFYTHIIHKRLRRVNTEWGKRCDWSDVVALAEEQKQRSYAAQDQAKKAFGAKK